MAHYKNKSIYFFVIIIYPLKATNSLKYDFTKLNIKNLQNGYLVYK